MTYNPMEKDTESDDESALSVVSTIVESETLTRVDELWFEEDNLIVRAEHSLFRVSKGILAARSPVLKAILLQPTPENTVTMYDCRILELPHSAISVTHFLKAIFDSDFFLPPPEASFFWVVVDILRLANEYCVKYLLRRALLHFETYYPSSPDGERVYDPDEESAAANEENGSSVNDCALVALQVAWEVDALWNIPRIIYDCCTLDLASLLNLPKWKDLPEGPKRQLLIAHNKQRYGAREVSQFLLADNLADCVTKHTCNGAKLLWLRILNRWSRYGGDSDPLALWNDRDWKYMGLDFCGVCLVEYEASYREQKEKLWDRLPESMGLPRWEQLLKMKDAILKAK
ncbi:hypothetical protein B0H19DRAFT_1328474 [Mycena capillaripes]|nr:hypothetical protein B0H19DRAFT_1328474 [Mycena capillaripes]